MSSHECKDLLVIDDHVEKPKVVAVLTSGDINAIYDEQLLNPPVAEPPATPLSRRLRRWFPKRAPKNVDDPGATRTKADPPSTDGPTGDR